MCDLIIYHVLIAALINLLLLFPYAERVLPAVAAWPRTPRRPRRRQPPLARPPRRGERAPSRPAPGSSAGPGTEPRRRRLQPRPASLLLPREWAPTDAC